MTLGSLSAGCEPHSLGSVSRMQRKTSAHQGCVCRCSPGENAPNVVRSSGKEEMVCWKTCGVRGISAAQSDCTLKISGDQAGTFGER